MFDAIAVLDGDGADTITKVGLVKAQRGDFKLFEQITQSEWHPYGNCEISKVISSAGLYLYYRLSLDTE